MSQDFLQCSEAAFQKNLMFKAKRTLQRSYYNEGSIVTNPQVSDRTSWSHYIIHWRQHQAPLLETKHEETAPILKLASGSKPVLLALVPMCLPALFCPDKEHIYNFGKENYRSI